MQPVRTKKIMQPPGTNEITQPLGTKKIKQQKKQAASVDKKIMQLLGEEKTQPLQKKSRSQ